MIHKPANEERKIMRGAAVLIFAVVLGVAGLAVWLAKWLP